MMNFVEGMKALVVDDQFISQKALAMILNSMSIQVVTANDGSEAVEQFDNAVNVIFMDFYMPRMNGDEASRKIREKEKNFNNKNKVYIIGMTANNADEIKHVCLDAGMNEILQRPISHELVEKLLEKYGKN